jgi:hypothetical protein
MKELLFAVMLVMLTAGSVSASDQADVMAAVHQFIDGETETAIAACADETSIIDEFPPYSWRGPGACARWSKDYHANLQKNGITGGLVTIGQPRHVNVAGDYAYVVVSASYSWKRNGKPVKETGSTFTATLQKVAAGWRITAWAWSEQ